MSSNYESQGPENKIFNPGYALNIFAKLSSYLHYAAYSSLLVYMAAVIV